MFETGIPVGHQVSDGITEARLFDLNDLRSQIGQNGQRSRAGVENAAIDGSNILKWVVHHALLVSTSRARILDCGDQDYHIRLAMCDSSDLY